MARSGHSVLKWPAEYPGSKGTFPHSNAFLAGTLEFTPGGGDHISAAVLSKFTLVSANSRARRIGAPLTRKLPISAQISGASHRAGCSEMLATASPSARGATHAAASAPAPAQGRVATGRSVGAAEAAAALDVAARL